MTLTPRVARFTTDDRPMPPLPPVRIATRAAVPSRFSSRVRVAAAESASSSREHLVSARADQPVQPPHRIGLAHQAQRSVPGERMLIVGIDERPVNVEDGDGAVSHSRPLPAIPVPNRQPQQ
jgi:hypothetical protein